MTTRARPGFKFHLVKTFAGGTPKMEIIPTKYLSDYRRRYGLGFIVLESDDEWDRLYRHLQGDYS